jgi:hypothetical protein
MAALPFIATAVAAVCVSLLAQALLWPRQPAPAAGTAGMAQSAMVTPAAAATSAPTAAGAAAPVATPAATPAPQPTLSDNSVVGLRILDLEEQNRHLWSAVYLLRAATQLDDAISALEGNDLAEADRTLLAVYRSLDRAYAYSAEQEKGPIDSFRLELSRIRDDLPVRPDGADRRLRQLRQLMLSLVEEGGA